MNTATNVDAHTTASAAAENITYPITGQETDSELADLAADAVDWCQEQERDNGQSPADRDEAIRLTIGKLATRRDERHE